MVVLDIATEDELSEAVAVRMVAGVAGLTPGLLLRRGGSGYLRSRIRSFSQMARRQPILIITDLDTVPCPVTLIQTWTGSIRPPTGLLLRIAVREIESWLLADAEAVTALLGPRAATGVPREPDSIEDPKSLLLRLATRASRDIRLDLCPPRGAIARQGLGYNARLTTFVRTSWDPERAALRSNSLRRAIGRIRDLAAD